MKAGASTGIRLVLRGAHALSAVPVAFVLLGIIPSLLLPIGGGTAHLLYAYSPGGNVGAIATLFSLQLAAVAFTLGFLRWTRFPLGWVWRALIVATLTFWLWIPWFQQAEASEAFERRGVLAGFTLVVATFLLASIHPIRQRWRARRPLERLRHSSE